jgi:acyl CoA:acetate/3-ketoacid CoA transferase alpha subunit
MNSNVLLEMLGEAEAFVAVMAAERALVSVDHLVSMKIF